MFAQQFMIISFRSKWQVSPVKIVLLLMAFTFRYTFQVSDKFTINKLFYRINFLIFVYIRSCVKRNQQTTVKYYQRS